MSAPLFRLVTYIQVRAYVAIRAKLQESRSKERLSFCLRAVAPFPHKVSSLRCGTLWGPRWRGAFAHLIQMTPLFVLLLVQDVPENAEHTERVLFGAPPSVGGENSPPNGVRRVIKQLRRGAGDRSARVLILTKHRCQGRENFCLRRKQKFSALFLDKKREWQNCH